MKKLLRVFLALFVLLSLSIVFTACSNNECTEHKEKWVIDTPATCTEPGVKHAECEYCGLLMKTETIDATGHDFTNYMSNGDATCLTDGTKTANCNNSGCNATDTRVSDNSALGHDFTNYVSNGDATCLTDGTKTANCNNSGCNAKNTIKDNNSKREHIFDNYIFDNNATCLTDGTETAKCAYSNCNATDTRVSDNSALGHKWDNGIETKTATCSQEGEILYVCERCSDEKTVNTNKPPHSTESKTIAATCDTPGYTITYCKNCSYLNWDSLIRSKEHSGNGNCSYCKKSYVTMLGSCIQSIGEYSTDSSGSRYGISIWPTSSVEYSVYYYPSTNKLIWWIQYYKNGSISTSFNLNMNSANGSYDWTFWAFASSGGMLKMDGTVQASAFSSNTTKLSYTKIESMPAMSIPTDLANQTSQVAATSLQSVVIYMDTITRLSSDNLTIEDFGFTGNLGIAIHKHIWAQVGTYTESTYSSNGSVKYQCCLNNCTVTKVETIPAYRNIFSYTIKGVKAEWDMSSTEDYSVTIAELDGITIDGVEVNGVEITDFEQNGTTLTFDNTAYKTALTTHGETTITVSAYPYTIEFTVLNISKVIRTAKELLALETYSPNCEEVTWNVWEGDTTSYKYDGYFVLGNSIDLGTTQVAFPITVEEGKDISRVWVEAPEQGSSGYDYTEAGFHGTFDGRGYTINGGKYGDGGLFGNVWKTGVIKNVAFENVALGIEYRANVIGVSYFGTMENVYIHVTSNEHPANTTEYGLLATNSGSTAKMTNVILYDESAKAVYEEGALNTKFSSFINHPSGTPVAGNFTNVYVFTHNNAGYISNSGSWFTNHEEKYLVAGVKKFALATTLAEAEIDVTAFDPTIWDMTGDRAKFKSQNVSD